MGGVEQAVVYFGKLPSRGDFVRSSTSPALIQSLDRWLSSGIELMADDAHWKQMYDQAPGARFAMLGAHRSMAIVGYLLPSADASGRRFPFLTAATIDAEADLLCLCPLMFRPIWSCLAARCVAAHKALTEKDVTAALAGLNAIKHVAPQAVFPARVAHRRYLEQTTLAQLSLELQSRDASVDLRQALLALGLLLQPLLSSGTQPVEKGLHFPLPTHEPSRTYVAALWMALVAEFLVRTPHDVSMFLPDAEESHARLLIGFSAGSAAVLHGFLDARARPHVFIQLASSAWVEDYVSRDYSLKKLSSYLQLPQLSLAQALVSFQDAFLGS